MTNSLKHTPFASHIERVHTGDYTPGDDPDNRLAIALDGGGMTTVHNAGMARVLEDSGIFEVSEVVVGVSAGAKLAASVVAGQLEDAGVFFKKTLSERKFINLWRVFGDGKVPVLNLAMLEHIITVEKPLDTDRIDNSPVELGIGITDITNYRPVAVSSKDSRGSEITQALMRSVHMPWVAGKPPTENGIAWADGGLSWMTTADVAKKMGVTHTVELSNNPKSVWKNHKISAAIISLWIHRYGSEESARKYRRFTAEQVEYINNRDDNSVHQIFPDVDLSVLPGTLCQLQSLLQQGYTIGQETARAALGHESRVVETHPEARRSLKRIIGFGKVAVSNSRIFQLTS